MSEPTKQPAAPASRGPETAGHGQTVDRDRRVTLAVDMTEEEIAAIEASEMTPGYEHLNAELDPAPAGLIEKGVSFARELRAGGGKGEGQPIDKPFRDGLYEDN